MLLFIKKKMKKQFRIGDSNTFLVSKTNHDDLAFAVEEIDDILDETRLKICNHFHDKQNIINRVIHDNIISCMYCKNENDRISKSIYFSIDNKIQENELSMIYLYTGNYEKDREAFKETRDKMNKLVDKDQQPKEKHFWMIKENLEKIKIFEENTGNNKHIFMFFLLKADIIYGYYTCYISKDNITGFLETTNGYFYIPSKYRNRGLCKILSKKVFDTQKNIIKVTKININNSINWPGIFCYASGAIENNLKIFFEGKESKLNSNTELSKIQTAVSDFRSIIDQEDTGYEKTEKYIKSVDIISSALRIYFNVKEKDIENFIRTSVDLSGSGSIILDKICPKIFYFIVADEK